MIRFQLTSSRTSIAACGLACIGLAAPAHAGTGDLPGTGPLITGAQIIAGPVAIAGDTSDNSDQFDVGSIPGLPTDCITSTAPDAWYTISIDAGTGPITVDIDLCNFGAGGTTYDSKIYVLDETMTPIACNDEAGCFSGPGPSRIENITLVPGTYELAIDGFGTQSGAYAGEIRLYDPTCFLDPPCTGPEEGEPCEPVFEPDNVNAGCNSTPPAFSEATIGQAVCGTSWYADGVTDTDWWRFNTTVLETYELEIRAEFDVVVFLAELSPGGTCPVVGIPDGDLALSQECDRVHIVGEYTLPPGDYVMFVSASSSSGTCGPIECWPCPDPAETNNAYELEIRVKPPPPPPCPWDLNANGATDFADVLSLISNWGPCPPPPEP